MTRPPDATPLALEPLPSPEESLELARRAQAGDATALGELCARYEGRLRRIVRIRLGPRLRGALETMDVVQSTFLVAVQKLEGVALDDRASVLRWLTRVAQRQIHDAADRHGALRRDRGREVPLDDAGRRVEPTSPAAGPPEEVARAELRELLDAAVAELPEGQREAILLRDYHGGSWEFVAAELGAASAEAARKLYHRGWVSLRGRLAPRLGGLAEDGGAP